MTKKVQFWQNGIMMGLVSKTDAAEIMANSRNAGYKVIDHGHYFTVDEKQTVLYAVIQSGGYRCFETVDKEEAEKELEELENRPDGKGNFYICKQGGS